jgi:ribosomal protein L7Ae-like RNA K-turn-binding protein
MIYQDTLRTNVNELKRTTPVLSVVRISSQEALGKAVGVKESVALGTAGMQVLSPTHNIQDKT